MAKVNPSDDIICPDASASTAIGAVKQSSVEEMLGMSHEQATTDSRDSRHDSDVYKTEVDKDLLKKLPPLDLCYDVAIDSIFYRVSSNCICTCCMTQTFYGNKVLRLHSKLFRLRGGVNFTKPSFVLNIIIDFHAVRRF